MASHAIEAARKNANPVFLGLCLPWLFIGGVFVLWFLVGAMGESGLCGESNGCTQALETAAVNQRQILERGREKVDTLSGPPSPLQQSNPAQDKAAEAPQYAAPSERKPAPASEQESDRAEAFAQSLTSSLRAELDSVRSAAKAASIKQQEALDQERDRADTVVRELASVRAELDATRIARAEVEQAAAAAAEQKHALEEGLKRERGRADDLARELTPVRADLDSARTARPEVEQAAAAATEQKQALEQELKHERDRADSLASELTSVRAQFDTARIALPKAQQAAATAAEQKHALEQELKQERDKTDGLAAELASLRAERDAARAASVEAVQTAEAAKIEQRLAIAKTRYRTKTLALELAAARKEAEEGSARLAAAHAEVLQVTETNRSSSTEQKQALASERDRADALVRELATARNQLESGNWQIGIFNAADALNSGHPAFNSSPKRMAEPSARTIEGMGASSAQISARGVISNPESPSVSEVPRADSTAREPASASDRKVATRTEPSTPANGVAHSPVDEQRLLARASALLRQADISGARPLLERAVERGSARAAFMLAETYDVRVLQSWRAHGVAGDLTKARQLYERAQAGGIEDAKQRIESLK
jgi:hypothetical protein